MARQWFVGKTHRSKETWAQKHLENQRYETYLPMCVSQSGRIARSRPFLPGYIFICFDPQIQSWGPLWSTQGMQGMLTDGSSNRPQSIPSIIVQEIKDREEYGLVVLPAKIVCKFKKGDAVKFKSGIVQAIFNEPIDRRRAEIFFELLGQRHSVIVDMAKLTAAPFAAVA